MKKHQQGPLERLFEGLNHHAEALSYNELKAELSSRGIDTEKFLKNAGAMINAAQRQHRLGWMQVADQKKQQIQSQSVVSWIGRKAEDIRAAYAALTKSDTAFAFRNKGELSVDDMAELLDAQERLRLRQSQEGDSKS